LLKRVARGNGKKPVVSFPRGRHKGRGKIDQGRGEGGDASEIWGDGKWKKQCAGLVIGDRRI